MVRYRSGIETREKILGATADLLGEVGLDGTTLQAICDRAGVRPGSFYNLFSTKEQAVFEVVGAAIRGVDPHPGGDPDDVAEFIDAYVRFVTGEPALARIYIQLGIAGGLNHDEMGERLLRHHQRRTTRLADAIARAAPGLGAAAARRRAEASLATLNGLALHWLLEPGFDFRGHAADLTAALAAKARAAG